MPQSEEGRLLLVDDDDAVLRAYRSVLARHGWTIDTAGNGNEAEALIQTHSFDVIVSDINMPGADGLSFLRSVRKRDLDVPVILVTGAPSVESSIGAIEYGVFRYLIKPVANEILVNVVSRAARLHKLAQLKRHALEIAGADMKWLGDRAALESRFESGLAGLWMAFQPIGAWQERRTFGYEALLRTAEPTLSNPVQFIEVAERLGRVHELGRAVRASVADAAKALPLDVHVFVNLHPSELDDDDLFDALAPLSSIAHRVVLEITERCSLEGMKDLSSRIRSLKELGFRIAIDDLGAGYAGLSSFTQLDPEIVKLDMSLVRGIDTQPKKLAIVDAMRKLCAGLGMLVVAEGIETPAERDTLVALGCDLFQGYLFARPARGFPRPTW